MRSLFLTGLTLALGAGCADSSSDSAGPYNQAGSGGSGGSTMISDQPSSLRIDAIGTLQARAQVEVVVQALPPRVYRVRFSLPSSGGDPGDATLGASEVDTDAAGRAVVVLTASSAQATFDVHASVGGVAARQTVSVAGPERARLRLQPVLLGHRQATSWVATLHRDKSCDDEDVRGVPPKDGTNRTDAPATDAPELTDVPIGVPMAVVLRSGHFMGGCQEVDALPPEATETPRVVPVNVLDRPMELAASTLSLSLGLGETSGTWEAVLGEAHSAALAGLHGSTSISDVDALLDSMQGALGLSAQQQSFQNARLAEGWDAIVAQKWGSASKMTDLVSGWLVAGKSKLVPSERFFIGFLGATDGGKANYALETVAGVPALDAGFSKDAQVTWSAGPDDTVLLSTFVYFSSSRLLTALAEPSILTAHDGAASVGAALSTELSCATLGGALAAAGSDVDVGYPGCDGACLTALCSTALVAIWQRARDATLPIELGIAATGQGVVGEEAELSGMRGTWVGKLLVGTEELSTSGALTGGQPPLSPP